VPLTLGGRDGALGLCPVCTCPDVQAPEAAPSASKKGDVGAGGTESSSSPPPKYCTYTGAKSVDEAGTTDAADGSATAGCSSSLGSMVGELSRTGSGSETAVRDTSAPS
jgi:hypothetical protein